MLSLVSTLNSVLLPTFGRPTIPICRQHTQHTGHQGQHTCTHGQLHEYAHGMPQLQKQQLCST
jgi:hypothetical protein